MTDTAMRAGAPLRIADMVPLRRMLGTDSIVIRVNPDGSLAPFERMPTLFFDRSIRRVLSPDLRDAFEQACRSAITTLVPTSFRPVGFDSDDEVLINPVLDNDKNQCRFLVCWARSADVRGATTHLAWGDLSVSDVAIRFRASFYRDQHVVEAAPLWLLAGEETLELWPHHTHVSAMGLGHAVMENLIYEACEAAAVNNDGALVRIEVPSADMLAGLVPVAHGALRASGVEASRIIIAISVDLAVDADLLPIIVHLRTMGMQIDIVGLDALTATLHTVSDSSDHTHPLAAARRREDVGPWTDSIDSVRLAPRP